MPADRETRLTRILGSAVPFLVLVLLALESGGYDTVTRGQAGILVWWAVLVFFVAGLLPLHRPTRAGIAVAAVLALLALWTGLATLLWSAGQERGFLEFTRVLTLLGFFVFFAMLQGRDALRGGLAAVGCAVGFIALVALASRFHPSWFADSGIPANYPVSRLNFPLDYWNGLAALLAIGIAPLLWLAASARSLPGRAIGAALIPPAGLALYLTASRGGAIAAVVALVFLFAAAPGRIRLAFHALVPLAGSALLIWAISRRPELRDLAGGPELGRQGDQMILITLVTCAGVAALQWLVAWAMETNRIEFPRIERRTARQAGLGLLAAAAIVVLALIASGFAGDRWSEFKEPARGDGTTSRLGNLGSGERYQVWDSALDAASSEPLLGIGPGGFEFWWSQNGEGAQFVRDAHSLYLESLAELGPIGLLLVLALVIGPMALACRSALGRGSPERRGALAAGAGGMAAFAVAAGVDWAWEMTVLPVAFLLLAAGATGPASLSRRDRSSSRFSDPGIALPGRLALALVPIGCILAIAVPTLSTEAVRSSQEAFRDGDLDRSFEQADRAVDIAPFSAEAEIQRALVLDARDDTAEAIESARDAVDLEPSNWRNWLVLSQIAEGEDPDTSAEALDRAGELNRKLEAAGG